MREELQYLLNCQSRRCRGSLLLIVTHVLPGVSESTVNPSCFAVEQTTAVFPVEQTTAVFPPASAWSLVQQRDTVHADSHLCDQVFVCLEVNTSVCGWTVFLKP